LGEVVVAVALAVVVGGQGRWEAAMLALAAAAPQVVVEVVECCTIRCSTMGPRGLWRVRRSLLV
jgi:hypothetical protein